MKFAFLFILIFVFTLPITLMANPSRQPICNYENADRGEGAQRTSGVRRNRRPCNRSGQSRLRTTGRRTGSELYAELNRRSLRWTDRDFQIVQWIAEGHVPDFMNNLQPVTFPVSKHCPQQVTVCVMPDYLAIGTNEDHFRVHLGMTAIRRLTMGSDFLLPTPAIVDRIFQTASVRITPDRRTGNQSTAQMVDQHCSSQNALSTVNYNRNTDLVAGHRKDVVIDPRLGSHFGRVAIYGWYNQNGSVIQPLSTVHGPDYQDYSHGVRLISRTAYVDERATDLAQLLSANSCISRNGPIRQSLIGQLTPLTERINNSSPDVSK